MSAGAGALVVLLVLGAMVWMIWKLSKRDGG